MDDEEARAAWLYASGKITDHVWDALSEEAMQCPLELLYAGQKLKWKTWEKRERNAKIYRRYLAGEDSMVLARV